MGVGHLAEIPCCSAVSVEILKEFQNSSRRFVASFTMFCNLNEETSVSPISSILRGRHLLLIASYLMVLHLISICWELQNLLTFAEPKENVIFVFCSRPISRVSRKATSALASLKAASAPEAIPTQQAFPSNSKVSRWRSLAWWTSLFK